MNQGGTAELYPSLKVYTFRTVFLYQKGGFMMYYPTLQQIQEMDLTGYHFVPVKKEMYSDTITEIKTVFKTCFYVRKS